MTSRCCGATQCIYDDIVRNGHRCGVNRPQNDQANGPSWPNRADRFQIGSHLPEDTLRAGVGRLEGTDPREIADSDLVVVWGGNPVSTQVNLMRHIQRALNLGVDPVDYLH